MRLSDRARFVIERLAAVGMEAKPLAGIEARGGSPTDAVTLRAVPDWLATTWTSDVLRLVVDWRGTWEKHEDLDRCSGYLHLFTPQETEHEADSMDSLVDDLRFELNGESGFDAMERDWPHWTPVFGFPSGDTICWDARAETAVFCEHDVMDGGPNVHGLVLAPTLEEFVRRWAAVGFIDQWDWSRVCGSDGIDIEHPAFAELRRWLHD